MSYNNPTYREIIENSTCYRRMEEYFCKSYRNLACNSFTKKHNRKPTIEDSEEVFKIFALEWYDYYIIKPKIEKLWYKALSPIYSKIIPIKVDVYNAACKYIEYITLGSFLECPDRTDYWYDPLHKKKGYTVNSSGNILLNKRVKHPVRYIHKNDLIDDFVKWVYKNKKHLTKHHKGYQDFSHLAYNNVTDDF